MIRFETEGFLCDSLVLIATLASYLVLLVL